ncbi:MAG: AraC family transcriptional regulator [Verrucomicrobiota bacterium]
MNYLAPVTAALRETEFYPDGLELLNYSLDYYYIKNTSGQFIYANQALLEFFDCSNTLAILGKTDHDFVPSYLANRYQREDRLVLRDGKKVTNKIELLSKNGWHSYWHITTKFPLFTRRGKICALFGITRDLNRRKRNTLVLSEMQRVLDFMDRNYGKKIKVSELADVDCLSISAFERKFKRLLGMTPLSYLKHVRLNAACRQLLESTDGISKIAVECGFCDQSYFTREFSRALSLTPLEYRKQHTSF